MRSRSRSCFRARSCHAISQNPQDYTVLSRVSGTAYRGTERISSNALLTLLEVGPDPVIRQKVANVNFFRSIVTFPRGWRPEFALRRPLEFPTVP